MVTYAEEKGENKSCRWKLRCFPKEHFASSKTFHFKNLYMGKSGTVQLGSATLWKNTWTRTARSGTCPCCSCNSGWLLLSLLKCFSYCGRRLKIVDFKTGRGCAMSRWPILEFYLMWLKSFNVALRLKGLCFFPSLWPVFSIMTKKKWCWRR